MNLPIIDEALGCRRVLIAGMGGGFDVFCGLPIFFDLKKRGVDVHLANFSFAEIANFDSTHRLSKTLAGITYRDQSRNPYAPEMNLARYLHQTLSEDIPIWSFHKTGAIELLQNYKLLQEHLQFDGLILVDGGVDCLVRGDEAQVGTLIEDALSLLVADKLENLKMNVTVATAFGVELDMAYGQVLENMANLIKKDALIGGCLLTKRSEFFSLYEQAVLFCQGQERQDPSVINSSIISAARGEFGDVHLTSKTQGSRLQINPLMCQYWFFETAAVATQNLYLNQLLMTDTMIEALERYVLVREFFEVRTTNCDPIRFEFE